MGQKTSLRDTELCEMLKMKCFFKNHSLFLRDFFGGNHFFDKKSML